MDRQEVLRLTTQIVASYVRGNQVAPDECQHLIKNTFGTLAGLSSQDQSRDELRSELRSLYGGAVAVPKVDPKRSVFKDHIICLECQRSMKVLKGHLRSRHGLSVDAYRQKYGLPPSYPVVCDEYSKFRQRTAVKSGLGRNSAGRPRKSKLERAA